MFSSNAYRSAGLFALCLLVSVVLSGALGGAQQQPSPQFQIIPPPRGIPSDPLKTIRALDDGFPFAEIKECGTTIAKIISFGVTNHRKEDNLEVIGGLRAQKNLLSINGVGPFPQGDYYFFLGHAQGLNLPFPPELRIGWFMVMTDSRGKPLALIYPLPRDPPWDPLVMNGDEMLLAPLRPNGIPSDPWFSAGLQCCDLTVRHLSVTVRKFSSPCTAPPCPAWWDILALATIANIGQIDLTEPFTVRVLLNGRLIQEEEIAGLAKGASQPILAAATVTQPGIYIVTVIVDPENKINERDETNNIAERSINLQ